ncbi:MAG: formylglycine-generating enzyme family protein [Gammaproteobacteria bacterium]
MPVVAKSAFLHFALCSLVLCAPTWAAPPSDMDFVPVPAGHFVMGTADLTAVQLEHPKGPEAAVEDETPAHTVTFTRGFEMARTETTQGQWYAVMGTRPGPESHWKRRDWAAVPVTGVDWQGAVDFARAMGAIDPDHEYALPTEAQWEYAARAGSGGVRPFADEALPEHAWYIENSGDAPQPVATRKANAWGLHDMLGNAWEWTADAYDPDAYKRGERVDPVVLEGGKRVRRGGSYHCPRHLVRPAYRAPDSPDARYSVLGFRVVRRPAGQP